MIQQIKKSLLFFVCLCLYSSHEAYDRQKDKKYVSPQLKMYSLQLQEMRNNKELSISDKDFLKILSAAFKSYKKCDDKKDGCCKKGKRGKRGKRGKTGYTGASGIGIVGPQGATGATGSAGIGGILGYAYIYNRSKIAIPKEGDVPFDTNGLISSGIVHTPSNPFIIINNGGIYAIWYSIYGTEDSQFSLTVNGVPLDGSSPTVDLPDTVFNAGHDTKQVNGHAILSLNSGDILTLRNHTSDGTVNLKKNEEQVTVNASMLMEQIG